MSLAKTSIVALIIIIAALASAADENSSLGQETFVFGAVGGPDPTTSFESGFSLEFGGERFFNRLVGIYGSLYYFTGGSAKDWWYMMKHPDLGLLTVPGTIEAGPLASISFGSVLKFNIKPRMYVRSKLGLHYSRYQLQGHALLQRAEVFSRPRRDRTNHQLSGELNETFAKEKVGVVVSLGMGFQTKRELDVVVDFTYRWKEEDEWEYYPQEVRLGVPDSGIPKGFSVGILKRLGRSSRSASR